MDTWPTGKYSLLVLDAICATRDGPHPEARLIIPCEKNATGRYLVIQIAAPNHMMTLCEVEVFAYTHNKRKYTTSTCPKQRTRWQLAWFLSWRRFLLSVFYRVLYFTLLPSFHFQQMRSSSDARRRQETMKHSRCLFDLWAISVFSGFFFRCLALTVNDETLGISSTSSRRL